MVLLYIMKKIKRWALSITALLFISSFFVSCATNSTENTVKDIQSDIPQTVNVIEVEEEPAVPQPTPEELFLGNLEGITLKFTKIPGKTKKNKAFSSEYELIVTDKDSNAVSDFDISIVVPVKKDGSTLVYNQINLTTDENGSISYIPEVPSFAAKTVIKAFPAIPEGLAIADSLFEPYVATADFIVESDIVTKGAIMFVFEYTESGKPSKNSYDILSGLRKKGVYLIGNAPISDTDYINASKQKIYKENYNIVGTDYGYLIGGTVKFSAPVEQTEDGYIAKLCADIYGIDMKTGEVIYENTHEMQASGTNWNYAVSNCRDELTKIVVDSIMFGL